jgi:hypothetical protein
LNSGPHACWTGTLTSKYLPWNGHSCTRGWFSKLSDSIWILSHKRIF